MEAVHADADAFHLGQLGVILLKHNVLCAKLVALVDDGLDVHDAGADFAEILVVGTLAEAVPRDEHVRVVDCPQVDRGIGGLGEILLVNELQAVAEAVICATLFPSAVVYAGAPIIAAPSPPSSF